MKTIARLIIATIVIMTSAIGIAQNEVRPRVFINPGHGGFDSNDRPTPFFNYGIGDTVMYYESTSNWAKGTALAEILRAKGYEVATTRVNNTTTDDLDLFEIRSLAANSGADMFFAIHSNATGIKKKVNFPLGLYRGYTGAPAVSGSDTIAALIMKHLYANTLTTWTSAKPSLAGDWSFYSNWGDKVGLGVLRYNKLPGLLSEGSFHDYIPERARLLNLDYCWLEAWNQSLGIDEWFGKKSDYPRGIIAGKVVSTTSHRLDPEPIFDGDEARPLSNVKVQLITEPTGTVVAEYTTDYLDNGIFIFKNVEPSGTYKVIATSSRLGALGTTDGITVSPNGSTYVVITTTFPAE